MKILLTGSTGFIAQRLLPVLLNNGHEVICKENNLKEILGIVPVSYEKAILETFGKIEMQRMKQNLTN